MTQDEFVELALEEPREAEETLAQHPEIAGSGLYAALVLGDAERVPADVSMAKGGPRDWEPLLYVCFSRIGNRAAVLTETARRLLKSGADPNTSYVDERWGDFPLSCLYGATGLNNNPALGRVLLEAGANPNDGESLYHSCEHADIECVRLLLEFGASPEKANALKHMLDYEGKEGLRVLLAAGANPNGTNSNGETALHWAVWRGRSPELVRMLLDAGAAVDARRKDGRTAYALAVRSGQSETAALLQARGADTAISEVDAWIGRGCPADLGIAVGEEDWQLLPEMASNRSESGVRAMLAAGVPVDTRGGHGGTALHWACWKGYSEIVKVLIGHGASLTIKDETYNAPPFGWYEHGLENSHERNSDYPGTLRVLREASGETG